MILIWIAVSKEKKIFGLNEPQINKKKYTWYTTLGFVHTYTDLYNFKFMKRTFLCQFEVK